MRFYPALLAYIDIKLGWLGRVLRIKDGRLQRSFSSVNHLEPNETKVGPERVVGGHKEGYKGNWHSLGGCKEGGLK